MHDIETGVKIQPTWIPPWCRDAVIMASMLMGATSLLRWLWQHICFHLVPYWMHKCVVFDLGIWLHFIPGGCMHMDEIQTSVVTPPLDLHWDQQSSFQKSFAQDMLPISTYKTPNPLIQVPTAPACAGFGGCLSMYFLLMGTSYKIPILPTGWNCHRGLQNVWLLLL